LAESRSRRAVVTGLGVITSLGAGVPAFREALRRAECGIRPVTLFDTHGFPSRMAGEVKGLDLLAPFEAREARRLSRCDLLGLWAAKEALDDARLDRKRMPGDRIGVVMGGGAGGMLSWEKFRRAIWSREERPRPSRLLPFACCTLTDLVAGHYGIEGLRATISTACSSSATSIGYGADLVRSGDLDAVIAGGSEALSELTFAGFSSLKVVDPEYCRPFDKNRRGLSLGEGAAVLVLEEYGRARERGAEIYGEVLGHAVNSDAYHITSPDPDAMGMSRVMARAMENAGISMDRVEYINAHGTGTKTNDQAETKAIKRVFGKAAAGLQVSSTKSMVGHCLGAAGAVEAVATIIAIHHQFVPPTIHLDHPDPECDLDYVPNTPRQRKIRIALSNSFAFGGNNTSIVFGSGEGLERDER